MPLFFNFKDEGFTNFDQDKTYTPTLQVAPTGEWLCSRAAKPHHTMEESSRDEMLLPSQEVIDTPPLTPDYINNSLCRVLIEPFTSELIPIPLLNSPAKMTTTTTTEIRHVYAQPRQTPPKTATISVPPLDLPTPGTSDIVSNTPDDAHKLIKAQHLEALAELSGCLQDNDISVSEEEGQFIVTINLPEGFPEADS